METLELKQIIPQQAILYTERALDIDETPDRILVRIFRLLDEQLNYHPEFEDVNWRYMAESLNAKYDLDLLATRWKVLHLKSTGALKRRLRTVAETLRLIDRGCDPWKIRL